ncbi:MAG: hypothetical protein GY863_01155 [bacterium]|nr:hypothetical protein [bacterium]
MKKVLLILAALIAVFCLFLILSGSDPAESNRKYTPEEFDRKYQPEELFQDLDYLIRNLEEIHPDLYWAVSEKKIGSIMQTVNQYIDKPIDRMEFYRIIAPIVSLFQDGHTFMDYPLEEMKHYSENKGLLFPIDVAIVNKKFYVISDYSGSQYIYPGSEISAINGMPAEYIIKTMYEYTSGKKIEYRFHKIQKNFRSLLWVIFGFGNEFGIEYISKADGKPEKTKIPGLPKQLIIEKMKAAAGTVDIPDYELKIVPENNTGIIFINSFKDHIKFEYFLKETFTALRDENIKNLIIDVRNNGGGNSKLGDVLLRHITDKPFYQISKMEIKVSKQSMDLMKREVPSYLRWLPLQYFHPYARKIWGAGEGNLAEFAYKPTGEVVKNPLRFKGDIYLLTGINTFSSAVMFSATFKDYNLGTIIGEETGGLATHFGDVYTFRLPNTRLSVGVPFKRFVRPSGEDDGMGVLPDINVKPEPGKKVDAIDFTLKLIKSKK